MVASKVWSMQNVPIRFVEHAALGIPSICQEILVPMSAYLCQFCDSAMEVQAAVDLSNGASLRGRLTRFEQRCGALCDGGKEWTLVEPRVRAVPDQGR
jgi:hypothetical protein